MRKTGWLAGLAAGVAIGFAAGRWSASAPTAASPQRADANAEAPSWVVGRVIDGDTLVLRGRGGEEHVRLRAVNTPERGQPGFEEAAAALRSLVESAGEVRLEYETPGELERDRYGRVLGYVFVGGLNTSVEVVRLGWSRYETRYGPSRYGDQMHGAQAEAQRSARGMWGM